MNNRSLCILVVGMHRSGTSAVTRVINLLGAAIASDLTPPQANNNERGFWESESIIRIHDELLTALGAAWDSPFQLPNNWLQSSFVRDAKHKLAERITHDFGDCQTLVVKDPRMARLLPLWLELLSELAIEPLVVIPFRNPLEVADSLERRQSFPPEKSLLLYLWSYLDAEAASRGRPRLFVGYDSLLADWRSFAQRINALAGGRLSAESSSSDIETFLSMDLHHNRRDAFVLASRLGMQSPVVEVFGWMRQLEAAGEQAAVSMSFERLFLSVASITNLFAGLIQHDRGLAVIRTESELAAVRHALAQSEEGRSAHAAELTKTWARIEELEKVYAARTNELVLTREHVLVLEKLHSAQQNEIALARSRNSELALIADELRRELAHNRARVIELAGTVTSVRNELSDLRHTSNSQAEELLALQSSTIWRITGPLRRCVEASRRLFGLADRR